MIALKIIVVLLIIIMLELFLIAIMIISIIVIIALFIIMFIIFIMLLIIAHGKPRKKPQPGNLPRPGFEPGPPGFSARRADRYSTGVDSRRRREDKIKMDLRKVGYDDRQWINLAQDRDRWRAYVRAAMNLRVLKSHFSDTELAREEWKAWLKSWFPVHIPLAALNDVSVARTQSHKTDTEYKSPPLSSQ
ncbi:hypothetical protein ANN_17066 [Periplaneta americana]|uniref:Uncharacterized protein n=1 Tax=Periplaneta americana TaxID=6978 RepID=A0ABQ8SRV4_PERAM|nr:hypothetical protein ANN_17066 [Periplaneta americana]